MNAPTYQELLADIYDDDSKQLLVHPNEYDDEEVEPEDKLPDELEHQEDFQKHSGSRQIVEVQTNIPKYIDKTKLSVTYDKDVKIRVINIDSRFRKSPNDIIATPESIALIQYSSTNFLYKLINPIKNVVSIRLSSIEIPNTNYTFSDANSNVSFRIYYPTGQTISFYDVVITNGNYIVDTASNILPNNLIIELETQLNTNTLGLVFQVNFNLITSRLTILETTFKQFDIDFITNNTFSYRISDWGLGFNLGFSKKAYIGSNVYAGENLVNAIGPNYLFLTLDPDWKVVKHSNYETTELSAFAKIIVQESKNTVIYDNGSNTITKEFWFDKPQTIRSFKVRLTDLYDQPIDLVGENMSLTIELKEVMNPSLYNHYTNQQQPDLET